MFASLPLYSLTLVPRYLPCVRLSFQLLLPELMACGVVGGAFSAITHPIDCIITNSQKPSYIGKKDPLTVAKSIYKEAGWKGFGRGLAPKILDNSYHTMWMYGIGTFVYEVVGKWTRED